MIILLIDADDQHHTEDDPKICLASDRRVFCGGRSRNSRAELQSGDKKAIWTQQKCKQSEQSNLGGKSQLSKASNTLLSKLKSFIFSGEAKVG